MKTFLNVWNMEVRPLALSFIDIPYIGSMVRQIDTAIAENKLSLAKLIMHHAYETIGRGCFEDEEKLNSLRAGLKKLLNV